MYRYTYACIIWLPPTSQLAHEILQVVLVGEQIEKPSTVRTVARHIFPQCALMCCREERHMKDLILFWQEQLVT